MNDKLKTIVDSLTPERREQIALLDALRAGLRVEIAGVDITALPALPPELKKGPQRPEPPGGTAPERRPRRRG